MSIEYRCPKKEFQPNLWKFYTMPSSIKESMWVKQWKVKQRAKKPLPIVDKMQSGSFSISCIPGKSEPKETETARKARYWPWLLSPYDHHYYLQNLPMTRWLGGGRCVVQELVPATTLYPHTIITPRLLGWNAGTPPLPLETITLLPMWPTSWYKSSSSLELETNFREVWCCCIITETWAFSWLISCLLTMG